VGAVPNPTEPHPDSFPSAEPELTAPSFAVRTLVTIAGRRQGVDAARCRLALLHFESATLIHRSLRRALIRHKLSDLQFAVLVILFATEPEPLSASVLAEHADVTRSAMTDALDRLEAAGLLNRTRDQLDRRLVHVRITPVGLETVDRAINDYLRAAEEAVSQLRPPAQRVLLTAYLELLRTLTAGTGPSTGAPAI
jgi:DNA-binding MarR family transcriptional regulator